MNASSIDKGTIATYDRMAREYLRQNAQGQDDPLLHSFIAAMPKGGYVLDLGCGPGLAAAAMAGHGLQVTATDASAEMVALASAHPGVQAQMATFDDIAGQDLYDGIWANFSLLHAPRADMPRHLTALVTALKAGGRFHIALKTGSGEKRDGIGRLYTYYSEAELRSLLEGAGLTITATKTGSGRGLDGTMADWIAITAHG